MFYSVIIIIISLQLCLSGALSQENTDGWEIKDEMLETLDYEDSRSSVISSCDFRVRPLRRCFDCYTTLLCTPFFGIINACLSRAQPYCNNGECSRVPSNDCF